MIATLACLLAAQSAQTDPAVLLRRDVTHSSSHVYWMSYTMQMDMAGIPGAEVLGDKPMTIVATFREDLMPTKGGKAKVKITVTDMKIDSPMAMGQKLPDAKKVVTMVIDSLNHTYQDKGNRKPSEIEASLFGDGQTPLGSPLPFPEKPVRYGETWSAGMTGGLFGGTSSISATFLGEEAYDGASAYRLMTSIDMDLGKVIGKMVPVNPNDPGRESAGPKGFMTVTAYSHLSKKDGGILNTNATGMGKFDISAQGQSVKMQMRLAIDLKRIK